jgi:hypothetical protein
MGKYLAYKRFLLAVYNFDYTDAKTPFHLDLCDYRQRAKSISYSKSLLGFIYSA